MKHTLESVFEVSKERGNEITKKIGEIIYKHSDDIKTPADAFHYIITENIYKNNKEAVFVGLTVKLFFDNLQLHHTVHDLIGNIPHKKNSEELPN